MVGKILTVGFWLGALALLVGSARAGGWFLLVPGAVLGALLIVGLDLWLHRRLVSLDREFVRALLHVLSAVTLASFSLLWLVRMLGRAPGP